MHAKGGQGGLRSSQRPSSNAQVHRDCQHREALEMRSFDVPGVRTFTEHFLILELLLPKTLPLDSAFPIRLGQCPGSYERSIEAWSSGPQSWSPPGLCQAVPRPPSQTEFVCVIPSLSSFCVHSVGWKEQKASGTACGSKGSRRGGGFQSPMTLDLPLF